jgi:hypothetical protein
MNNPNELSEAEQTRRGQLIVNQLELKEATHYTGDYFVPPRYDTAAGNKTAIGIFRMVARLVLDGE